MAPAEIQVEVAVGMAPRQVERRPVTLAPGATVKDALLASGVMSLEGGPDWNTLASGQWFVGIWGRRTELDHVLRERDRVELYRGLNVDPKEARRLRYRAQGEKLPKGIQRSTKAKT